ncbi:MAG: hypothetical protein GY934_02270 [Gammaproteobacteria bacterium]|nr:hypothetical protein [Gammaproteobacteria bacterium]
MSEAQDRKIVKDAENSLDVLFERYGEATPADKWILKPALVKASEELLTARLALFKDGVLTTQDDINMLAEIEGEIENAADTQALIMSAIKLAAFLGAFA